MVTQLPNKFVGDTIEFILEIGTNMTGQTSSSNPGGIMVNSTNNSIFVNASYSILDITSGKFHITFDTSSLISGEYNLQLWWEFTDSNGVHRNSTQIFTQILKQKLSGGGP